VVGGLVGAAMVLPSQAAADRVPAASASPSTVPLPPPTFVGGWMIDPPVPGFAYGNDIDPTHPPGTWTVLPRAHSYNSVGHPNAVGKVSVGHYVVWLPGIRAHGVATVADPRCSVTEQVSSPAPYFGTDLVIACVSAAGEPIDIPFSVEYSSLG
jgi:hypothetical protein